MIFNRVALSGARLLLTRLPLLSGSAQLSQQRVRASQRNTFGTSLALFGSVYQWKGERQKKNADPFRVLDMLDMIA